MPIYEFTCGTCNEEFDLLLASRTTKPACPKCSSKKVIRKFSTFAAHQGSSRTAAPCASGVCPGVAAGRTPCSAGRCPLA